MRNRQTVINDVADRLVRLADGKTLRVAVDGRTASGKTTFANELASTIGDMGRPVIRASIDGFHRPKVERYRRGRLSAEGYYYDARDLDAIVTYLLEPLNRGGDRLFRAASFDLIEDKPITGEPEVASHDAILIVDGTFLQRPELAPHWDAALFVQTDPTVSLARGLDRDAGSLGGRDQARISYEKRYRPAYEIYEAEAQPEQHADLIFNNDHLEAPTVYVRSGSRLRLASDTGA
ncbi:uridylate kinase [Microbacterium immunditiarum]|uniref:Uridine kinase n=1 Tax=Microbacterium immunditiarum TaxID=337480 RepID=A0A7Y9GPD0_9MICO|nr:uridylate kinase [Microbacterium immunditiarum]NYE20082.1 uridine kinase [Microbacterium immunditiarum]